MPTTVLGWIEKVVNASGAPTWSSAAHGIVNGPSSSPRGRSADRELPEQEKERDERGHRDRQRAGEQRAEQLVIVLHVHVEHHDDRELGDRHDEKRRHEERRL